MIIKKGDIISRRKHNFEPLMIHYGVATGYNNAGQFMVIENTHKYGVREITLFEFIKNATNFKIEYSGPEIFQDKIVYAAKSYLGQPYSLLNFNCEHFANLVMCGKPLSKQINVAKTILGLSAFIIFANKIS